METVRTSSSSSYRTAASSPEEPGELEDPGKAEGPGDAEDPEAETSVRDP